MSVDLPWLGMRPVLLAAGHTDGELRRFRRAGQLTTIRRGAYVLATDERTEQAVVRHLLQVRAVLAGLQRPAVVSHGSAAVVLGLPVWSLPLGRVHLTRAQRHGGRVQATVHLHTAPLRSDEITEVDGIPVTTLARTVIDLARSIPFEPAVVVADAALRAGLGADRLSDALRRMTRWPGAPAARRVVGFADARSESVGESRSRVAIYVAGLPPPIPQWEVWRGALLVGRCDFGWPGSDVVGEFDGRVKYGRSLRPGVDPAEVVYQEKLREDELRAQGLTVVRWAWRDLGAFGTTAARLGAVLRGR